MIFLGDGEVGKTSLIDKIVFDRFSEQSNPTDGLRMVNWKTHLKSFGGVSFTYRFLDFGGQEILHAMHRCFLTKHTVYVVVCESRDDTYIDSKAAWWLRTVKSFAPDCPVILALNKADQNQNVSVNELSMRESNPKLVKVLKTSAKDNKSSACGTDKLIEAIETVVPQCMDISEVGENWRGLERSLEELEKPYITSGEYRAICNKNHIIDSGTQRRMLERLRDLGIAYFYEEKDSAIADFRILNPRWLTDGMYRLILQTPNEGFIQHKRIKEILTKAPNSSDPLVHKERYTEDETEYILQIMRKFEISCDIGNGIEMIPMKMDKTPSQEAAIRPSDNFLHLRWNGAYLPDNLIHRLIVRKFDELDRSTQGTYTVWRSGGRFRSSNGCIALAEIKPEGVLDVYVSGDSHRGGLNSRRYLHSFRQEIIDILKKLNIQTETKEFICFTRDVGSDGVERQSGEIALHDVLEQLYQFPDKDVYIPGILQYLSPWKLLDQYYVEPKKIFENYQEERGYKYGRQSLNTYDGATAPEDEESIALFKWMLWFVPPLLTIMGMLILSMMGRQTIMEFILWLSHFFGTAG